MMYRSNFPELLNQLKLTNIAIEVGVCRGEFASTMLKKWNGKYYMVDTWSTFGDKKIKSNYEKIDEIIKCINNIRPYEKRAFMLRIPSNEAVHLFQDNSIDFIYIDANHEYSAIKQDIKIWYPKIKSDGILAGHDYFAFDCHNISEEYGKKLDEKNIAVWGRMSQKDVLTGPYGVNFAVDEFIEETGYELRLTDELIYKSWYIIKK